MYRISATAEMGLQQAGKDGVANGAYFADGNVVIGCYRIEGSTGLYLRARDNQRKPQTTRIITQRTIGNATASDDCKPAQWTMPKYSRSCVSAHKESARKPSESRAIRLGCSGLSCAEVVDDPIVEICLPRKRVTQRVRVTQRFREPY
jgi:hypothetical protein